MLSSLTERVNNLNETSIKLSSGEIDTLADVIIASLPSYRRVMFLKIAVMMLNSENKYSLLELKRNALGEAASFASFWDDLCDEFDDDQECKHIIEMIDGKWNKLSLDNFISELKNFLSRNKELKPD